MKSSLMAVVVAGLALTTSADEWGYTAGTTGGPSNWAKLEGNAECAGRRQSPIDIVTSDVVEESPAFMKMTMPVQAPPSVKLENTGHGLKLDLTENKISLVTSTEAVMTEALQLHFHVPSEHTIDGKFYPAEVHLVTRSINHYLFGGRFPITVLGVMYQVGDKEDSLLRELLANPPNNTGDSVSLYLTPEYDLPSEFYTYDGSLTTPPCWETVNWYVGTTPRMATQAQIDALNAAQGHYNNRPVQPRNLRSITKRKYVSDRLSQTYKGCKGSAYSTANTVINFQNVFDMPSSD